ncbi:MAG: hypothetical protein Q6354_08615, partial [Candidatus Brocadiales bacterium]|nr:hypothetical protein [Candidatus Brocadiales bacterium]
KELLQTVILAVMYRQWGGLLEDLNRLQPPAELKKGVDIWVIEIPSNLYSVIPELLQGGTQTGCTADVE